MRSVCSHCKVNARPINARLTFNDGLTISEEKVCWKCPKCGKYFKLSEIADYVDKSVTYIYKKNYKEAVESALKLRKG